MYLIQTKDLQFILVFLLKEIIKIVKTLIPTNFLFTLLKKDFKSNNVKRRIVGRGDLELFINQNDFIFLG